MAQFKEATLTTGEKIIVNVDEIRLMHWIQDATTGRVNLIVAFLINSLFPRAACQNRHDHLGAPPKASAPPLAIASIMYRLPNIEEQQGQERGTSFLVGSEKQLGCAARFSDPNFHFIGGDRKRGVVISLLSKVLQLANSGRELDNITKERPWQVRRSLGDLLFP
jgi:hypothetical protein